MFQTKVVEKIKTHILYSVIFFPENCAVYEIMWKNNVQPERAHMTIWRMRIACWITKAINTRSEYVMHIAFPLQQSLHERASIFRYTILPVLFITEVKNVYCTESLYKSDYISSLTFWHPNFTFKF